METAFDQGMAVLECAFRDASNLTSAATWFESRMLCRKCSVVLRGNHPEVIALLLILAIP
jgi:hypothetical protein